MIYQIIYFKVQVKTTTLLFDWAESVDGWHNLVYNVFCDFLTKKTLIINKYLICAKCFEVAMEVSDQVDSN